MKLLYVLGSYFPAQSGGPNNTIHWQAKTLVATGEDITVVSLKDGIGESEKKKYNINFNELNNIDNVNALYFDYAFHRLLSFKFYIYLLKNINKFELVNLTSYFFPITWVTALICIAMKKPFSIAPRGELEDNAFKYNAHVKKIIHYLLLRHLYKKAAFIMVTSKQELRYCKKYFPDNIKYELIPNYIELDNSFIGERSVYNNKQHILYLGRLHPKKGIEILIDAYDDLDEKFVEQHQLLIAGSGDKEYTKKLQVYAANKKFSNKIIFLGHLTGVKKEKIYQQSKMLILPSHSENFGNVVLEALQYGTPVITSKNTPWEDIEKYKCGEWVDNNVGEIKAAIIDISNKNKEDYAKMCQNAINFVIEKYDVSMNVNTIKNTFGKYIYD